MQHPSMYFSNIEQLLCFLSAQTNLGLQVYNCHAITHYKQPVHRHRRTNHTKHRIHIKRRNIPHHHFRDEIIGEAYLHPTPRMVPSVSLSEALAGQQRSSCGGLHQGPGLACHHYLIHQRNSTNCHQNLKTQMWMLMKNLMVA